MRGLILVALLLSTTLAGCSGGGAAEEDPFKEAFDDVDVATGKGLVRGVVVDTSITPVAQATVTIKAIGVNVTSDENGLFLIKDIEPGDYFLTVTKVGYASVQSSVSVKANEEDPPVLRVQIEALPGLEPRYIPLRWDGHIGCSFRRWNPPSGGSGQSCPYASTVWPEHDFLVDYELDQEPSWIQSTMEWDSTQRLGHEMSFNLRRTDTNADTKDIEGASPLIIDLTPEDIALHDEGLRGGFGQDMPLRVIVFTAHLQETEPPTGGWGFGLQVDQPFQTYTQIFYNQAPPAGWEYVTDGDP